MKIKHINVDVIRGDITALAVDAIVNPANQNLTMDKGLAGFIKKEGGETIAQEALLKAPVSIGGAIATTAGTLKAQHVIHAVSVDEYGRANEHTLRRAAYQALVCADQLRLRSIAIPALGCGEGGFSPVGSAKIMTQEIFRLLRERRQTSIEQISFCLYDEETFQTFQKHVYGYARHIVEDLGPGPYVCVDIIIELEEGIVIIERTNPPYGWALPGGFLDYGESLEQAAIREAKEETNLDIVNLRQFHTYSDPGRDPRFHTISTVFIAQGRGQAQAGDDAKNLKIVRYEDLPQLDYAFDHKEIIKEYLVEREFG